MKKIAGFILLIFAVLLLCVGCDSESDYSEQCYVRFTEAEGSGTRAVSTDYKEVYDTESVYWAYTARKIDGLYTEGESTKAGSATDTGSDGVNAGGYKLRPVKQGPGAGLSGAEIGPFATGLWEFKIYGYKNYKVESGVGKFDGLVYTGVLSGGSVEVRKTSGNTAELIRFEISLTDDVTEGAIRMGDMGFVVPWDMHLREHSVVTLKVYDITDGAASDSTLIAVGTTTVTSWKNAGEVLNLSDTLMTNGESSKAVTAGVRKLRFVCEYKDGYTEATYTGYEEILDSGFQVIGDYTRETEVLAGRVTIICGTLNDATDGTEALDPVDAQLPETKILKAGKTEGSTNVDDYGYFTLADACNTYYGSTDYGTNPILLVKNLKGLTTVTTTKDVVIVPQGHSFWNLKAGSGKDVTVKINDVRSYVFSDGTDIKKFGYKDSEVHYETAGSASGGITVNAAADTVYHNGDVRNLTVEDCSKYYLTADVLTDGVMTVKKGDFHFGEGVKIDELVIGSTSGITLHGTLTTEIGNINALRDGGTNVSEDTGFVELVLNSNNGESATKGIWGIQGMYVELPDIHTYGTGGTELFTKGTCVFKCWTDVVTKDSATVSFLNNEKAAVDSIKNGTSYNLYAQWGDVVATTGSGATLKNYGTLKEAIVANAGDVTLVANVPRESAVTVPVNVNVIAGSYSIGGLKISGSKIVTVKIGTTGTFKFSGDGAEMEISSAGTDEVRINTNGGTLDVNADTYNVVHTGSADNVVLTKVTNGKASGKGYHEEGAAGALTLKLGYLALGEYGNIGALTFDSGVSSSNSAVAGQPSSVVGNINNLRDGKNGTGSTALTSDQKALFKTVTLNYGTSGSKIYYCIEGMTANLPDPRTTESEKQAGNKWFENSAMTGWNTELPVSMVVTADKTLYNKSVVTHEAKYRLWDYLRSDGNQYINTGYVPSSNTNVELVAAVERAASIHFMGGGGNGWAGGTEMVIGIGAGGSVAFEKGKSKSVTTGDVFGKHTFIIEGFDCWVNGCARVTIDSTSFVGVNTVPLYLFGVNRSDTGGALASGPMRIYSVMLKDGDTLRRHFVPAERLDDGVLGMLDLVEKKFYENEGTGSFSAGYDYTGSLAYDRLSYIHGNDAILTGVVPDANTDINVGLKYDAGFTSYTVFGAGTNYNANALFFELVDNGSNKRTCITKGGVIVNDVNSYITSGLYTYRHIAMIKGNTGGYASVAGKMFTSAASTTITTTRDIALFGRNYESGLSGSGYPFRLHWCKIYKNGVIERDFVPAKLKSNNKVGLIDVAHNTFYSANDTTKTFDAGEVTGTVGVSTQYELLEYISSNNTTSTSGPYIDTGKTVKNNTGVEIKFYREANGSANSLFGARLRGDISSAGDGTDDATDFTLWTASDTAGAFDGFEFGKRKVRKYLTGADEVAVVKVLGGRMYWGEKIDNTDIRLEGFDLNVYIGCANFAIIDSSSTTDGSRSFATGLKRYYYYKQFEGEELVLDLIPAKRKSDNKVGMLDLVSGSFFFSGNGVDFTAGPSKDLTVYR